MTVVKVGDRRRVTLPKEIAEALKLKPGDYVKVTVEGERIVIVPWEGPQEEDDSWF